VPVVPSASHELAGSALDIDDDRELLDSPPHPLEPTGFPVTMAGAPAKLPGAHRDSLSLAALALAGGIEPRPRPSQLAPREQIVMLKARVHFPPLPSPRETGALLPTFARPWHFCLPSTAVADPGDTAHWLRYLGVPEPVDTPAEDPWVSLLTR